MVNHPNRSKHAPREGRNPTPEEIVTARSDSNLTQTQAAEVVYCTLNAWQKWEAGERRMHPAIWELFRIKTCQK
jgi:DNA-binding transcriptional regulator YiaG